MATAIMPQPAPALLDPKTQTMLQSEAKAMPSTTFNPARHMAFQPPESVVTLRELLLSEENACSPIAITKPFPLFSLEGVVEMRKDVFRESVIRKHGQKIKQDTYKMRGYSRDTPFVDSVWRSPEVIAACSQAAGIDLQVIFDYEIGHVNVQLDELADKENLWDVLPPAYPPKNSTTIERSSIPSEKEQLSSVRDWHVDSYPWVCVCMLSDPQGMVGGETGLEKGDGSVVKMLGPDIGWAVMMQGGCINHIALRAFGAKERITMVTSFKARDPLTTDMSTLFITNKSSRLDELFLQWTVYRMEVLAARAKDIRDRIEKGNLTADEIKVHMRAWVEIQTKYLETTCREMDEGVPYGMNKNVH
ncbi:uncharacterized protein Z520_09106 [Fonsecaea multimorphosa CBS 102226]|uniref:Uncharacterized protein n=1 Tax=Fonsecaea multimorphosa CBS 102226 TaxID=1442371 RepID=A0A0D2H040_9EURO|nr:uncharacterized protein Z520_09106 [Fonsecaea multimorphosa CBS 102226]KIX95190.1 hypothetical protein Z520_09106 [Fonsecaea multimorphosa CBS 102226]OAL20906.1 hypothetical protein AYO22_08534 [Fonsecaea multimorphosa]